MTSSASVTPNPASVIQRRYSLSVPMPGIRPSRQTGSFRWRCCHGFSFPAASQAQTTVDDRQTDHVIADQWTGVFHEIVGDIGTALRDPVVRELAVLFSDFGQRSLVVLDLVVLPVGSQDRRHVAMFSSGGEEGCLLSDVVRFVQVDDRGISHAVALLGARDVTASGPLGHQLALGLVVECVRQQLSYSNFAGTKAGVAERIAELKGSLGPGDRRKLDEYLSSVREVEQRAQVHLARAERLSGLYL